MLLWREGGVADLAADLEVLVATLAAGSEQPGNGTLLSLHDEPES